MKWFKVKQKPLREREAWLNLLEVFDAHHHEVRTELEAALAEEEGYSNGNGHRA